MAGNDDPTRFRAAYDAVLDRWPGPVDRLDLTSAYGTTRVTAYGPEGGEPLVLLHGGGGATSTVWFANAAGPGRTRRIYAVDRIGEAGRSVRGDRPLRSTDDLHAWLDGVLDDLGLDRPDLCGHSYGGWIALTHALRAPRRVRKLVLLDPTQCFAGLRPGYLLRALPLLVRPTAERARAFLAWETRGTEIDPTWRELYGRAADSRTPGSSWRNARALKSCGRPPCRCWCCSRGTARAHDSRRVQAAVSRHLPRADTAVLAGLSHHAMPFVRAAELDHRILEFLVNS
ncbi:alpha/beta fold hydrolase [Streptomyces sp. NPDC048650]|uniref:alpha/beta fold hydrolase n=1 Tax=Streptomyces sp. NPDC048650 TaxID=3365583 RepID=UPI003717B915